MYKIRNCFPLDSIKIVKGNKVVGVSEKTKYFYSPNKNKDISATLIGLANRINGAKKKCKFLVFWLF